MLILFDIDMTLLSSNHIGIDCLRDAGRTLFAPDFCVKGIKFGGAIDPNIIRDMLEQNNIDPSPANTQSMRTLYHRLLADLAKTQAIATPLPGAHDLVNAVAKHESKPTLGLLTGNFEETGTIKIQAAGFNPTRFTINAWGDDSPHPNPTRAHLPPIAIKNYETAKSKQLDPQSVVIIGDTEHDVSCALNTGCRSLAVATGHDSRGTLEAAGAHRVVDDLTQTKEIIEWIMNN